MYSVDELLTSVEEFEYYQDNWCDFIEDCILAPKGAIEKIDFKIDDPQREIIESVNHNKRTSVVTAKGLGKTTLASWLGLTFMTLYNFPKVAVTAPAGTQLNSALWPEINMWLRNSALEQMFEHTKDVLKYVPEANSEWKIYKRTPKDITAAQGLHKPDLLILCDESAGIKDDVLSAFDGTLTDDSHNNNKILLIGNGNKPDGFFFDTHSKPKTKKYWQTFSFSAFQSKFRNDDQINYIRDRYGEDHNLYKIEVLGQFPDANASAFISYADVIEASQRWYPYDEFEDQMGYKITGDVEIGLDCAGDGEDNNVAIARQGNYVFKPKVMKYGESDEVANMVLEYVDEIREMTGYDKTIRIKVDTTGGYGSGPYSYLRNDDEHNVEPVKVNFAWKAFEYDEYDSVASEMWGNMRDCIKQCILYPNDQFLIEELHTRKIEKTGKGKTKVQAKSDYKKEYGASPDRADAVILCFADVKPEKMVVSEFDPRDKGLVNNVSFLPATKYASVWVSKDLTTSILYAGWDGFKLQIYDTFVCEDSFIEAAINLRQHGELNKKIGNRSMFNKRSNEDVAGKFKGLGQRIRENDKYDELGSLEALKIFIHGRKMVIDPRCQDLISQLRDWKFDTPKNEQESRFGLCKALSNLICLVKDSSGYMDSMGFSGGMDLSSNVKQYKGKNTSWLVS